MFSSSVKDTAIVLAELLHGFYIYLGAYLLIQSGIMATALYVLSVGILMNWSANTVGHIHLHNPIFRYRSANVALDLLTSTVNSYPQAIWKFRHLRHHAGGAVRSRFTQWPALISEIALIIGGWVILLTISTYAFLAYLVGTALGLAICWVQGRYEHFQSGRGFQAGISHYGRLYNLLFFNDGYHVEHHRYAHRHWTELPRLRCSSAEHSALPPQLRWAESQSKGHAK
jgi:fatty acid desaturase